MVSDAQDRTHHDANILMTLTALHAATEDAAMDRQVHTIFEIIDQQNQKLADTFHLKNRKVASLLSTEMVSDYFDSACQSTQTWPGVSRVVGSSGQRDLF